MAQNQQKHKKVEFNSNKRTPVQTSFAPFLPLTEQMERQSRAARGMSGMYMS